MATGEDFLVFSNNGTETTYTLPKDFPIDSGHTYTLIAVIEQGGGVEVQIIGDDTPSRPIVNDPTDGGDAWNVAVSNS
jgi:hypothetical protein